MDNKRWLLKYACCDFEDDVGNAFIVNRIKEMAFSNRRMHLILVGPDGIGKRILTTIFINKIYGNKTENVLQFSSSCDRSIQNIRDTVQNFVSKKTYSEKKEPKIIVFEDAETISEGVQQLMRSVIEKHSCSSIMCIFLCHKVDNLIESLQSRCLTLKMEKLKPVDMLPLLSKIIEKEALAIYPSALSLLMDKVEGDVRQAINYLEILAHDQRKQISEEVIHEVCLFPCYSSIEKIVDFIFLKNDAISAMRESNGLAIQGYSAIDILGFLQQYMIINETKNDIVDSVYGSFINELTITTLRLKEGVNSHVQLCGMFARLVSGYTHI